MSIEQLVTQLYKDYENREIEKVLAVIPDDFCFDWPVNTDHVRFSGQCQGKGAFIERLQDLAENFVFHAYEPRETIVGDDSAAVRIRMELTSNHTGERFEMEAAHFWHFASGKPVHLAEYYDTAQIARHMP